VVRKFNNRQDCSHAKKWRKLQKWVIEHLIDNQITLIDCMMEKINKALLIFSYLKA
jgi:hypothetical protein